MCRVARRSRANQIPLQQGSRPRGIRPNQVRPRKRRPTKRRPRKNEGRAEDRSSQIREPTFLRIWGRSLRVQASQETGPVHEVTLGVRLAERIELPDLKARLIIARLQALGDVISTVPPVETLDQLEPPITLQIRVRSTADHQVLTNSIDLEGVAAVFVIETAPVTAPRVAKQADAEPPQEPSPEQAGNSVDSKQARCKAGSCGAGYRGTTRTSCKIVGCKPLVPHQLAAAKRFASASIDSTV